MLKRGLEHELVDSRVPVELDIFPRPAENLVTFSTQKIVNRRISTTWHSLSINLFFPTPCERLIMTQ